MAYWVYYHICHYCLCHFIICGGTTSKKKKRINILYQLYRTEVDQSTYLKEIPDVDEDNECVFGSITSPNSGTTPLEYYIRVPKEQVVLPGTYSDTITATLYEGLYTSVNPVEIYSESITINIPVAYMAELSLIDTDFAGPVSHNQDLGSLYEGYTYDFHLYARSNKGYKLYCQSENESKLIGQTTSKEISYSFTVDASPVNLNSVDRVLMLTYSSSTNSSGNDQQCVLTVGECAHAFADTYEDCLTFTIEELD